MNIDEYIVETVREEVNNYAQKISSQQLGIDSNLPNRLLTKAEVASLLSVSTRTIDRMIQTGKLPSGIAISGGAYRSTRRWRINDLYQYITR